MYKNRPLCRPGDCSQEFQRQGRSRDPDNIFICDWICENQPDTHKNLNSFFLTQLIAILNNYPYTMSPVARLRWSAFLRGGFTAL